MRIVGKKISGVGQSSDQIRLDFDDDTTLTIKAYAHARLTESGQIVVRAHLDLQEKDLKLE